MSVPNGVQPQAELDLAELQRLHDAGSAGEWLLHKGITGTDLWITTWWRNREGGDGGICTVSKEHWRPTSKRGERGFKTKPVKNAENDAKLIVAAVNALPELIRRAGFDGNETAWLIEWPADDYGPIRYWAAGRPKPVIDVHKATRFSRREDAVAVMGAYAEKGAKVHEHMWMRPASAIEAQRAATAKTGAVHESAVGNAETPNPDLGATQP